jgi:hypothetical protein
MTSSFNPQPSDCGFRIWDCGLKTTLSLILPPQSTIRNLQSTIEMGDWGRVYGQLLTFDDPETRLPAIDRLEGFRPGGSSLYKRVLVPVCIEQNMALPVWAYVAGESLENSSFIRLEETIWNPEPR